MPDRSSWLEVADGSDFPLANLPYGVGRIGAGEPRTFVALGAHAVDLHELLQTGLLDGCDLPRSVFARPSLNAFLALGPERWTAVRSRLRTLLARGSEELARHPRRDRVVVPRDEVRLDGPVAVGDYVDFYSGIHHAEHIGRLFRPDSEPLFPSYRRIPVGYHGRAGTIVGPGTTIPRPSGVVAADGAPVFAASDALDVELELGAVVGVGNDRGRPIAPDDCDRHVFGFVLVNDWSARDVQAFEYQPLGPFLGKSFATSIGGWVVPFDALRPHLVGGLPAARDDDVFDHLRTSRPWVPDLELELLVESRAMRDAGLAPVSVARVRVADALFWSAAQQLAHLTSNGTSTRPGDLVASGTLSGPDAATEGGSLIELTWRGERPLDLPTGERRAFLADGDRVVMRAHAGADGTRVGFGELDGTILGREGEV